jgi:hypothetical protein
MEKFVIEYTEHSTYSAEVEAPSRELAVKIAKAILNDAYELDNKEFESWKITGVKVRG